MPLFEYAGWASSLRRAGEGCRGGRPADPHRPEPPNGQPGGVSYAFFMVGRYADALRELTAKPEESLADTLRS